MAVKLKKSKMVKADRSKFELENVDLKGFKLEKKSHEREGEDLDFEVGSATKGPIPRPPKKGLAGMRKSDSMSNLEDLGVAVDNAGGDEEPQSTDQVLNAANRILMKGKKAKEAGYEDDEEERRKLKPLPLKKTPSIQALYQSQEIETEFKMVLPTKEEGPTKVVLQLPEM